MTSDDVEKLIADKEAANPDFYAAPPVDELALMLPTAAEPPNGQYHVNHRPSGKQLLASYPNGYGASVITGRYAYGDYELAVLHGEPPNDELCYRTPITSDVVGWLNPERVVELLHQVAALPRNDDCDHDKPDDWWDRDEEGRADVGDVLDSLTKGILGS